MAQETYWENGREKTGTMMSRAFCSTGISLRKVRPGWALANWRARVAHSASEARYCRAGLHGQAEGRDGALQQGVRGAFDGEDDPEHPW